jgi:hypothetical protein
LKNRISARGTRLSENDANGVADNLLKPAKMFRRALNVTGSNPTVHEQSDYNESACEEMNDGEYPIREWLRELRLEKIENALGMSFKFITTFNKEKP